MSTRLRMGCLTAIIAIAASLIHVDRAAVAAPAPDGKAVFAAHCSACHLASGLGGGPYPPLAGNPDVLSPDTQGIIATVLNGRNGPITVLGRAYGGAMPTWRVALTSADIAAVLTYVRSSWGNAAAAITEDQVAAAAAPMALSGADLFAAKCSTCHQANGRGTALIPPLAANPDVLTTDPKAMVAIIVNGRTGPIEAAGKTYDGTMPVWRGQLSNADIAAVATYVRSAWGNTASGVTEQQVASAGTLVLNTVGAAIYAKRCSACHQASGKGSGPFPALAGDAHVNAADASPMLGTILHGRNVMPAWKGQLSAGDIAAVATYVRSAWGNKGAPVDESAVSAIK